MWAKNIPRYHSSMYTISETMHIITKIAPTIIQRSSLMKVIVFSTLFTFQVLLKMRIQLISVIICTILQKFLDLQGCYYIETYFDSIRKIVPSKNPVKFIRCIVQGVLEVKKLCRKHFVAQGTFICNSSKH